MSSPSNQPKLPIIRSALATDKKQVSESLISFCAMDLKLFHLSSSDAFYRLAQAFIDIETKFGQVKAEEIKPCPRTISISTTTKDE